MEEDYTGPRKREAAYKRGLRKAERMGISVGELLVRENAEQARIAKEFAELRCHREEKRKADESWLAASDRILAVGGLNDWEDQFVRDIQQHMKRSLAGRRYTLSNNQQRCFAKIYRRTVK
jgi:hypothetical protein